MRCHYEVLEVERSVDDATLRTAYRKAALRWHPGEGGQQVKRVFDMPLFLPTQHDSSPFLADKNQDPGKKEEAEERFREVQSAYEVLSDKHERSWWVPF